MILILFVICSAPRQPIYSSDSSDDSFDEEKEAKGQKRLMKAKKLDSDEVRKEHNSVFLGFLEERLKFSFRVVTIFVHLHN